MGIEDVFAFINRIRDQSEAEMIREHLELPVIGTFEYDRDVADAGLEGSSPVDASPALRATADTLLAELDDRVL